VGAARPCGVAAAAAALALVAACGPAGGPASGSDDGVAVVASTNVWGDIAAAIGGDDVTVTSLIADPSADPHSYEASARTQLAVRDADLVVENGGGYDAFMDDLLSASDQGPRVIDAVDVSGRKAEGGALNEHVWYDLPTVERVADRIVSALGDIDPPNAGAYETNGRQFDEQVQQLRAQVAAARPRTQGAGVAVTEPVPGYLLEALGAVDRTPAEFSEALEEGDDAPPSALQRTLDLFSGGRVRALVYNEQTTGPETQLVVHAARKAGVAVVPVTEILPEGQHYVPWMRTTVQRVVDALSS
jgi:zinc/manganese transport system substrate-binding protein